MPSGLHPILLAVPALFAVFAAALAYAQWATRGIAVNRHPDRT